MGRYYNSPSTDLFLDKYKPSYIGGMLEMANHRLYPFWGQLTRRCAPGFSRTKAETAAPTFSRRSTLTLRD